MATAGGLFGPSAVSKALLPELAKVMYVHDDMLTALTASHLVILLCVSSFTDVTSHRIPNALLLPVLVIAALLGIIGHGPTGLAAAVCGLLVGLAMLLPLYIAGGTAGGDVKLLGVAGSFLGPTGAFFAGLFTLIAGAVLGLLWIVWQKKAASGSRKTLNPLTHGITIPDLCSPAHRLGLGATFAYAPAIAAGVLLAAWHQGWNFYGV